jgi:hypothetical protein
MKSQNPITMQFALITNTFCMAPQTTLATKQPKKQMLGKFKLTQKQRK